MIVNVILPNNSNISSIMIMVTMTPMIMPMAMICVRHLRAEWDGTHPQHEHRLGVLNDQLREVAGEPRGLDAG